MALISPGIQVSVTDESQYAPTSVGTIPLIVIATSQDKTSGTSTATAAGTTKANAEMRAQYCWLLGRRYPSRVRL